MVFQLAVQLFSLHNILQGYDGIPVFAQCATSLGLTNELKIPNTAVGEIDRYLSVTIDESVMSFWEDNSKNAEQFPRLLGTQEAFQLLQLRWKEYSALLVTL